MAGGGGNQMQQPGGAYGQAISAGGMGGMKPNQPILQMPPGPEAQVVQPQMPQPMPRQIGTMGPGAGMAPMQQQIPQEDPYAARMKLLQGQTQYQNPYIADYIQSNQRPMPSQIGTMGPGAGMAPPPTFGQANPQTALPGSPAAYMQQLYSGQQIPYMDYMKQVLYSPQYRQQMPQQMPPGPEAQVVQPQMPQPMPRQIGTMGPGAGMAPTQTGLGAQGTLAPPNMGMPPMQQPMSRQMIRENRIQQMSDMVANRRAQRAGGAPTVGGIGSLASSLRMLG